MRFRSSRRVVRTLATALAASVAPIALIPAMAQDLTAVDSTRGMSYANSFDAAPTPLEQQPDRLFVFDTANVLPQGASSVYVGTMQTDPSASRSTGYQVYFTGLRYGVTDGLTLGLDFWNYDDVQDAPIAGGNPQLILEPIEASGRMRIFDTGVISGAAQVSVGYFMNKSPFFGGNEGSASWFGSVKAPLSYSPSQRLQFHLTPGVSFFADESNGADFYGTIYHVGMGASYLMSQRLAFYGAVDVPFGSGGNTLASDGSFENVPVWTLGGRYNLTPRVALDLFATNGLGTSPATSILTHFPDGDDVLVGAKLTFTPGAEYRETYRGPLRPLSFRQERLQHDGILLASADVVDPGTFMLDGWYGTGSHYGGKLSIGAERDFQIELMIENYADEAADNLGLLVPGDDPIYMVGPKLRFLDQNQGDPISLGARILFGRELSDEAPYLGIFYGEGTAGYQVNDALALNGSVKVASFSSIEVVGLGMGVNYELFDGLEVIGEATLVGAEVDTPTWALGLRYTPENLRATVDLSASNAVGRYGIGTMLAREEPTVSLGLSTRFSLR